MATFTKVNLSSERVSLSFTSKTVVKFNEYFEFSTLPECLNNGDYVFHLQDFKGEFDVENIRYGFEDLKYDALNHSFKCQKEDRYNFIFSITSNVRLQPKNYVEVPYKIEYPAQALKMLKIFDCYNIPFCLPGFEKINFNCCIAKFEENRVTYTIKNPYNIRINDREGDYVSTEIYYRDYRFYDFNLNLSFVFDRSSWNKPAVIPEFRRNTESAVPESITIFQKAAFNPKYADVFFISSTNEKIPSHRLILAEFSKILEKVFEGQNISPVTIDAANFESDTIKAALNFCYCKNDAILGKEFAVLQFANSFGISKLQEFCYLQLEALINPSNVCKYIQLAYDSNLNRLKNKCKTIMLEKKAEIDQEKLKALPKDILFDVYCAI